MQDASLPLRYKTALSIFWSGIENVGYHIINITAFLFFVRILTPVDFGIWALFVLFSEICMLIINPGFTAVLLSKEKVANEQLDAVFWFTTLVAMLCVGVAWLGATLWETLFSADGLSPIMRASCIMILLNTWTMVPDFLFRRKMDFKTIALRRLIGILSGFIFGIPLLIYTQSIWALVCFHVVASIGRLLVLWIRCPWKPSLHFPLTPLLKMAKDGMTFSAASVLGVLANRIPVFFVGLFYSTSVLGYFSLAYRIIWILIDMLSPVVGQVCAPLFSLFKSDISSASRYYLKLFHFSSCLTMPTFAGLAITASWSVPLICGPQWQEAAVPLQWLAIAAGFKAMSYKTSSVLLGLSQFKKILIYSTIVFLLYGTLILSGALLSLTATSIAICIAYFLTWPIGEFILWPELRYQWKAFFTHLAGPLAATLLMLTGCFLLMRMWPSTYLHFGLLIISSIALYGLSLLLIDYQKILHWVTVFTSLRNRTR